MDGMFERTGSPALAVVAKGNRKDAAKAQALFSGGAGAFIEDVFKITIVEFLWRFEAWCCTRDVGACGLSSVGSLFKR